jgi:hypothetical protein
VLEPGREDQVHGAVRLPVAELERGGGGETLDDPLGVQLAVVLASVPLIV